MPDLLVEARRVAATVLAGWHGRRVSGRGETFWQFRPFVTGEPAAAIDWRRSARDDHLYVREKEWEASHTVWLWADLSASMDFRSRLAPVTKRDPRHRADAWRWPTCWPPPASAPASSAHSKAMLTRNAAERIAALIPAAVDKPAPPDVHALRRFTDVVLVGDFLDPIEEIEAILDTILTQPASTPTSSRSSTRSRRPSPMPGAPNSTIRRPGCATSSRAPSSTAPTTRTGWRRCATA